jgi:hypothetical protein
MNEVTQANRVFGKVSSYLQVAPRAAPLGCATSLFSWRKRALAGRWRRDPHTNVLGAKLRRGVAVAPSLFNGDFAAHFAGGF